VKIFGFAVEYVKYDYLRYDCW